MATITLHGIKNVAHQSQIKLDNGAVFDITTFELPAHDYSNTGIHFWVSAELKATIPFDRDNPSQVMGSVKEMLRQYNLANETKHELLFISPSDDSSLSALLRGEMKLTIHLRDKIPEYPTP